LAEIAKTLQLLQHRVGPAAGEHVTGQQQHGKSIDVRDRGCGHHVGGARADGGRTRQEPPASIGLGEGDRAVRHRLFVVGAKRGQAIAHAGQCFTERRDVTVAEDREHAGNQRGVPAVDDGLLRDEVAHQRLAHRESHGLSHGQPVAWLRPARPACR
jgi:hypothetical protein